MDRIALIETSVRQALEPTHFEIEDDSHKHRNHPGAKAGGGHFNIIVVSPAFEGKSRVTRQRMVYAAVGDAMGTEIHALAMTTLTPQEWSASSA